MREKKTSFSKKETENEFVSSKRNSNSEEDVYIIWTNRKYEQNLSVSWELTLLPVNQAFNTDHMLTRNLLSQRVMNATLSTSTCDLQVWVNTAHYWGLFCGFGKRNIQETPYFYIETSLNAKISVLRIAAYCLHTF